MLASWRLACDHCEKGAPKCQSVKGTLSTHRHRAGPDRTGAPRGQAVVARQGTARHPSYRRDSARGAIREKHVAPPRPRGHTVSPPPRAPRPHVDAPHSPRCPQWPRRLRAFAPLSRRGLVTARVQVPRPGSSGDRPSPCGLPAGCFTFTVRAALDTQDALGRARSSARAHGRHGGGGS